MERDKEIYKAFLLAKEEGESIASVAKRFSITRAGVYLVVKRIRTGNPQRLAECLARAREECLWEHKYSVRHAVLPKKEGRKSSEELKGIVRDMYCDNFSELSIVKRLSLTRTIVRGCLNK